MSCVLPILEDRLDLAPWVGAEDMVLRSAFMLLSSNCFLWCSFSLLFSFSSAVPGGMRGHRCVNGNRYSEGWKFVHTFKYDSILENAFMTCIFPYVYQDYLKSVLLNVFHNMNEKSKMVKILLIRDQSIKSIPSSDGKRN